MSIAKKKKQLKELVLILVISSMIISAYNKDKILHYILSIYCILYFQKRNTNDEA